MLISNSWPKSLSRRISGLTCGRRTRRRNREQRNQTRLEVLESRAMLTGHPFVDSGQLLTNNAPGASSIADLDGDGDLDIFIGTFRSHLETNLTIRAANQVWLNDGSGTFSDTGQLLGHANSTDTTLGDIDGDGDLDALVANFGNPNQFWINDGLGDFTAGQALPFGTNRSFGVALSDLDGDGDLDAFIALYQQGNRVYFNDGSGNFTDSGQSLGSVGKIYHTDVSLADLDGDGDIDAFVTTFGAANEIWLNDGSGTFTAGQTLSGPDWSIDVALGDLDRDGDLDAYIAIHEISDGDLHDRVLINNGSGVFSDSGQSLGALHSTGAVGLADVDNDGDLDAVTLTRGFSAPTGDLWLNDGAGVLTLATDDVFDGFGTPSGAINLGDLDGDGDVDIVRVGSHNLEQRSRIFFNTSPPPVVSTTTVSLTGTSLLIEDSDGGNSDDNLTLTVSGTDLVISDPNNLIGTSIAGATGDGTNTVTVPLGAFSGGLTIDTKTGNDVVNLAAALSLGGAVNVISDDVNVTAAINTGGDAFTITADNNITGDANGNITTGGGLVTLSPNADGAGGGSVSWLGDVSFGSGGLTVNNSGTGSLTGLVTGTGDVSVGGSGTLTFGNAGNNHIGTTFVRDSVTLNKPGNNTLSNASGISLLDTATLNIAQNDTIRDLNGAAGTKVTASSGNQLIVQPIGVGTSVFAGAFQGASLTVNNSANAPVILTGNSPLGGNLRGSIQLNSVTWGGNYFGSFGPILSGNGTVSLNGSLTNQGKLSPGVGNPGILNFNGNLLTGTLAFYDIELDGSAGAGVVNGHDQVVVGGDVSLVGPGTFFTHFDTALRLFLNELTASEVSVGQEFMIIKNNGPNAVKGTFRRLRINNGPLVKGNLLEGDTLVTNLVGSGLNLDISYVGGTGNDIVLKVASPNSPPVADAGGPYSVAESGSVGLDGSGSSDPDQSAASLTYEWDLDGDNVFGETGAAAGRGDEVGIAPTFSAAGLDGFSGSTFSVSLRVTDDFGVSNTDSATVNITNVAPDAALSGPGSGLKGDSINFTLGATDVSSADQSAGFTYNIDWDGDGTVDQTVSGADGLVVSHTFATAGSTTVKMTATDKDGGVSSQVSHTIELIQLVDIDVKPGNSQNKVNAKSQGVIPVVIYTTADFDAASVIGSSVQLAGVNAAHFTLEDVDGDGDLDLVLHFNTQAVIAALGIDLNAGESITVDVELTGQTIDDVFIQGFDTIEFFQPGKGKGKKK